MTVTYRVAICVATYKRPFLLRQLLSALDALEFRSLSEPEISLIVVDNDPDACARPVVTEFVSRRFHIRYQLEPRPGISHARNTAVSLARGVDFLAFLDDDEQPSPAWLDQLLSVHLDYDAPIVSGRVIPVFEVDPPALHGNCGYFHRPRHANGTRLASASTANVLIHAPVFQRLAPQWFDPRFSLTGGEDTHFFRRAIAAGFHIVAADGAVAYETISADRITPQYLISRARSGGNHWTRVDLDLHPTLPNLTRRFAAGLARFAHGSAIALSPAAHHRFRGRLLRAEAKGNLDAFFGRTYTMYGGGES